MTLRGGAALAARRHSRLAHALRWAGYAAHLAGLFSLKGALTVVFTCGILVVSVAGLVAALALLALTGGLALADAGALAGALRWLLGSGVSAAAGLGVARLASLGIDPDVPEGHVLRPAPPRNPSLADPDVLVRASSPSDAAPGAELLRPARETAPEPSSLLRAANAGE